MAQTVEEVTSWDVLANGKEYIVSAPGTWDADNSTYIFAERDFEETFSINEDKSELTIAQTTYRNETKVVDGDTSIVTYATRTASVHSVDTNGEYLDYTGTLKGNHNIGFKSLEIVKYGNDIGLHDYNKNTMRILHLPAKETTVQNQ